jgi:flagellar M-ring protein FliF
VFERFRSYSPARQIALIAAFVGIIGGGLGMGWYALLRTPYQPLFSGLRPADAATIVAELDRRKIPYRLDEGGAMISVPADQVDSTRLSVMTQDLPLKGTVGFELFNKSDFGLTDFVQRINYQRALQGELERTIMKLDGVDAARVHLSLGEDRIFRDDRVPPKASASIRMKPGAVLSDSAVLGIQRLVAAAVPKLEAADVVMVDEKGQLVGNKQSSATVAGLAPPSLQARGAIEQYYQARIRQALERLYPRDAIVVGVSADPAVAGGADGLARWNPEARVFSLQVDLAPTFSLEAPAQENVRKAAAEAIRAGKNDLIRFSAAPEPPQQPANVIARGASTGSSPLAPVVAASPQSLWPAAAGFGLVVLLAGVLFLLVRQLRRARRLTERQRAEFTARLRAVLEEGNTGVASRS